MPNEVLYDRVCELSTTTGTSAMALAGAITGYRAFSQVITTSTASTFYCIENLSNGSWEVGSGRYSTSANNLTRTSILASSNNSSAVNFTAGNKTVFLTIPAAPLRLPDVQTYTSAGSHTWTKPYGTRVIKAILVGGGGGGGSGRRGAAASNRGGGSGGGGGAYTSVDFSAFSFGNTGQVTVGIGGTGGTGQTVNNTDGNDGLQGGDTYFQDVSPAQTTFFAGGGSPGLGGINTIIDGGAGGRGGQNGSSGGSGRAGADGSQGHDSAGYAAAGGGGSGGIDSANARNEGGMGGISAWANGAGNFGTGGTGSGVSGGNCSDIVGLEYLGGGGGGGGAAGNNGATSAGGNGGNGGRWGGGGGGGGASTNGQNSGTGGNGAQGVAIIISF